MIPNLKPGILDWQPIYKQYSCDEDDILVFKREPSKNPEDQWVHPTFADEGYLLDISDPKEYFVYRMKTERPGLDKIEIIYTGGAGTVGPKIFMTINVRSLEGPAAIKKAETTQKFKKQIADLTSVSAKNPKFDQNVLDLFLMHQTEHSRLRREQIAEGFNSMAAQLEERLENGDEDWRIVAVCGIGHCTNTLPKLRQMLKQESKISGEILGAIAEMNTKESIPLIAPYLHDKDDHLAGQARDAMRQLTKSDFEKVGK